MYIHKVLFKIAAKHVPTYKRDCRLWHREASKHPGFMGYRTLVRVGRKGEYASLYIWKSRQHHVRFMKKHHDRLVSLSQCPVRVVDYFDYSSI